jgi:DNA-directed RNA polymerase subunit RPC12/RpoP
MTRTDSDSDTGLPAAEAFRFPCEQCGAQLRFAPGQTELTCTHCGHVQSIAGAEDTSEATVEHDYTAMLRKLTTVAEYEDTKVLSCPNCGARTAFPEGIQAALCPFCDTPVVTGTGAHRQIKPAGLVPFQLDEKAARAAMTDWLGRLWFAPDGLKEYARKGRAMTGIYVPYWTFDARTETDYRGQRGDDYYETQTVVRNGRTETIRVRRTRWRSVAGRVARAFDDVLVLASTSLPKRYADALQPWDLRALTNYRPQFLAGFGAEGYSVGLEEGFAEGRRIMDEVIRQDIRRDIGGDHQRITMVDTRVWDVTFKHILLPVWMAAYKYRGKTYRLVVNGQTGKVQGERPWSAWKIAIAVILALILAGAVAYLAQVNPDQGAGTVSVGF